MIRRRFAFPFLPLLTLALLPASSQAQDVSRIWEFMPKAGSAPAVAEALRAHVEYRKSLGDPWDWFVYQVEVGEESGKFYAASWNHSWADFDAYDAWEGAAAASAHFQATVGPLLDRLSNQIVQANHAVEKLPDDPSYTPTFVDVTDFYVNPGKQAQFNENLMKFHEAIAAADMPFYYTSDFLAGGGEGPLVSIAVMLGSWADFADPEPNMQQVMVNHYGEEEAQRIMSAFGESFHYTKNFLVRFRPDLSLIHGM